MDHLLGEHFDKQGPTNNINNACHPLNQFRGPGIVQSGSWGYFNGTEAPLLLWITDVLLLQQFKRSVQEAYTCLLLFRLFIYIHIHIYYYYIMQFCTETYKYGQYSWKTVHDEMQGNEREIELTVPLIMKSNALLSETKHTHTGMRVIYIYRHRKADGSINKSWAKKIIGGGGGGFTESPVC